MNDILQKKISESWLHHMRRGEFEEAWQFSDKYLELRKGILDHNLPRHYQNIWDGSSLKDKRVLIRCYHGLGDTIQFIRYAPLIKAIAKEVIVWAQPELIPILQSINAIDKLLPLHDGVPEAEYDLDIEVMETPHIFRTTLETIPNNIPYLFIDPIRFSKNQNLNVGLVWKAGNWNVDRNVPYEYLAPLAEVSNINLYILQQDASSAGWKEGFGIYPGEFSLFNYAGVIKGLDLLISVDSMPVHLAGALGVPVWTLVSKIADWRWMENRNDSPWYPTMKLFRQSKEDDWSEVINNVVEELRELKKNSIKL